MRTSLLLLTFFISPILFAQKKPLDHSVYDSWQSIGEKMISNDGKWVVYTINVQEGDNELVIQSADAKYKKTVPRGYNAVITEDSRFVIFKIKPFYKDLREARIKKKKPDDSPKDSLAIVKLGNDNAWKLGRVKTYKTPAKSFGWVAYHEEKAIEPAPAKIKTIMPDAKKIADSLNRVIDSLRMVIEKIPPPGKRRSNKDDGSADSELSDQNSPLTTDYSPFSTDADGDETPAILPETGTTLILRKLETGVEKTFNNVLEYYFSKNGQKLLIEASRNPKDSLSRPFVLLYDLRKGFGDTLSRGGNDYKNFALTDDGSQVAYLAERDAKPKDLQKFYRLWYFKDGMDSATLLVDRFSPGMQLGMTISEFGNLSFSKSGKRLFFGTAPIQPPKDTTLVDIDLAKLDIWHYNDDYLQTVQLFRLQRDLQENFLAVYLLDNNTIQQLGSKEIPVIYQTNEGDGETFVGVTDFGKRVESQWTGTTQKDIYAINVNEGTKKLVKKDMQGVIAPSYISPTGKYIMWYESKARNYFVWDGKGIKNITSAIKVPLYNEENDVPNDPSPYGIMRWHEGDSAVYVYDRYDVWKIDLNGKKDTSNLTHGLGRKQKKIYRYIQLDSTKRFLQSNDYVLFRMLNKVNKDAGLMWVNLHENAVHEIKLKNSNISIGQIVEARNRVGEFIYTKENYQLSPDLFISSPVAVYNTNDPRSPMYYLSEEVQLSSINPQQKDYNWGTAELFKWKTFKGKESEGILYKPEDFNPAKKYPVIIYFYETLSDGLNSYIPPAPTPSRLNISFFVSRGYVVFAPDIRYTIGHPAQSAYDYVVSGAKALTKYNWIDAKNMAIQGQSWGGIQVAQLVTMTNMFKAAWAGAPVANMTSAYGGIRWESGVNRQFQYEKDQSRIGATLWEKPELYIENSPLFHLPKVTTPLVIMSNDADGAVPWYQGIELFTAMRRLGKKVWMLSYNGEAHNLVERRNRKDIQVREQQYFDWLLKGEKPPKWITEGVPAVKKGKDWGLEIVE
ncbi:MAG: prolyl oligopeptidase family serine peptidase [Bacteroidota bacterium]|nr:prolyl oligopeptidase family serine peptidase [Bacteroidota bacterium]